MLFRSLDLILGDGVSDWKYSTVKERSMSMSEEKMIVGMLSKTMHTYFQIDNFVTCIDKVLVETSSGNQHIDKLLNIRDDVTMESWLNAARSNIKSKRIVREENHGSLEDLFQ